MTEVRVCFLSRVDERRSMKIIALGRDCAGARPEDFAKHAVREAEVLYELWQRGFVRETHFRADANDAVLVLEASELAEAETLLERLPLVGHGLIEFDLIPLRPYPGFDKLFGDVESALLS
jgi:hypothetical protein